MDDASDRGYSRAPEFEDLLALCRSLNAHGVRYVLIGGFAVILHGSVRGTKDIDLLVDVSEDNVRALKRAMAVLPDNAINLIANDEIRHYQVVRIADEIVVDLMGAACGIDYAQAAAEGIERRSIEEVEIPIATKELLIRTKNTYRDSDRSDVAFLRVRIEEEKKAGLDTGADYQPDESGIRSRDEEVPPQTATGGKPLWSYFLLSALHPLSWLTHPAGGPSLERALAGVIVTLPAALIGIIACVWGTLSPYQPRSNKWILFALSAAHLGGLLALFIFR